MANGDHIQKKDQPRTLNDPPPERREAPRREPTPPRETPPRREVPTPPRETPPRETAPKR